MTISIGVFAYNEEGSIGELLDALLAQDLREQRLAEIIVVSFGSTDATDRIVAERMRRAPCLRLLTHTQCLGKATSVARFLGLATSELLVMVSGDAELRSADALYQLLQPLLHEPAVGIVGARHCISNPGTGFVAFAGARVWSTLHLVSGIAPKISGDLMAMRAGIATTLPSHLVNDDAFLEFACQRRGLHKRYCPDAEVYIRIPENLREYLSQRRRIYGGHRQLEQLFPEYRLSTTRFALLSRLMWQQVTSVRTLWYSVALVLLDAAVRGLSRLDNLAQRYKGGRWPVIFSTKFKHRAKAAEAR